MTFNADAGATASAAADAAEPAALQPTPTSSGRSPLRLELFSTLTGALEYAGRGEAGYNFYNLRGGLSAVLTYSDQIGRAHV